MVRGAVSGRGTGVKSLPWEGPLGGRVTSGKLWRFRRDLVIYLSHTRLGLSQRFLADVFDLPRSRVAVIVKRMGAFEPAGSSELE